MSSSTHDDTPGQMGDNGVALRICRIAVPIGQKTAGSGCDELAQPMMESVEAKTAKSAEHGAHAAFTQVYEAHYPRCFGFFRSRVLDTNIAADLTQEAFLRAYGAMPRFDESRRIDSWLMGICRNVLREYVRREQRRREIPWAQLCLEVAEMASDNDGEHVDMMPHLPDCISQLAPKTETVLRAHYFEGKTLSVVAADMRQSLSAVKMTLLRARRALKTCIRQKLQGLK